jgi:hypothetical protein
VKVKFNASALGESRWYEYLVRFIFGGAVTVMAGVIAERYGPGVGGLFLAFPAIFPAAVTLISKHEETKEESAGGRGRKRASMAAGLDAVGAAFGAIGLVAFAIIVWQVLPKSKLSLVLPSATAAWAVTSVLVWEVWEMFRKHARNRRSHNSPSKLGVTVEVGSSTSRRVK